MKNPITLTTIAALMLGASVSYASAEGRKGQMFDFSAIDADSNGEITQAEISAFEAARFAEIDANSDGELSQEELVAHIETERDGARIERRVERMISHLDADDSGTVSLEEQQASERSERMFDRLDRDDDGTISQAEVDEMKDRHGKRKGGKGNGKGNGKGSGKGKDRG